MYRESRQASQRKMHVFDNNHIKYLVKHYNVPYTQTYALMYALSYLKLKNSPKKGTYKYFLPIDLRGDT